MGDEQKKPEEYRGDRWILQIDGDIVRAKPVVSALRKSVYEKKYTKHGVGVIRGRLRSGADTSYLDAIGLRIFSESSTTAKKESPKKEE